MVLAWCFSSKCWNVDLQKNYDRFFFYLQLFSWCSHINKHSTWFVATPSILLWTETNSFLTTPEADISWISRWCQVSGKFSWLSLTLPPFLYLQAIRANVTSASYRDYGTLLNCPMAQHDNLQFEKKKGNCNGKMLQEWSLVNSVVIGVCCCLRGSGALYCLHFLINGW